LSSVSHRLVRRRGVVVLVAVAAITAGLGQTGLGHAILRKAGLFGEPPSYTSLAFLNPQYLPKQLDSKGTDVDVSFTIHNTGGTPRDYQWSVLQVQGQRTRRVAVGSVRVAPGRGTAIIRSAKISCTRGQVQIVVSLERPTEYIDDWMSCSP
jgi:hypothetical protein